MGVACVVRSINPCSVTGDSESIFAVGRVPHGGAETQFQTEGVSLHIVAINRRVACKSREGLEEKVCWCRHGLTRERVSAAVTSPRVERIVCWRVKTGFVVDVGPPASTGFSCVYIRAPGLDRLPPCQLLPITGLLFRRASRLYLLVVVLKPRLGL